MILLNILNNLKVQPPIKILFLKNLFVAGQAMQVASSTPQRWENVRISPMASLWTMSRWGQMGSRGITQVWHETYSISQSRSNRGGNSFGNSLPIVFVHRWQQVR